MKPSFYHDGTSRAVAQEVLECINSSPDILSEHTKPSTRAAGDAIEHLIAEQFGQLLGDRGSDFSVATTRKSMEDFSFTDQEGFYSAVDVKTHREGADFGTYISRYAKWYYFTKISLGRIAYLSKIDIVERGRMGLPPTTQTRGLYHEYRENEFDPASRRSGKSNDRPHRGFGRSRRHQR